MTIGKNQQVVVVVKTILLLWFPDDGQLKLISFSKSIKLHGRVQIIIIYTTSSGGRFSNLVIAMSCTTNHVCHMKYVFVYSPMWIRQHYTKKLCEKMSWGYVCHDFFISLDFYYYHRLSSPKLLISTYFFEVHV